METYNEQADRLRRENLHQPQPRPSTAPTSENVDEGRRREELSQNQPRNPSSLPSNPAPLADETVSQQQDRSRATNYGRNQVPEGAIRERDEVEFTEAHRTVANRAFANGKVIVLDRGPAEPVSAEAVEGERTEREIEAENRRMVLAKREHDAWHKVNSEPVALEMNKIDADHAVNVDPDRYVHVPRGVRAPVTIEERVAKLEQRMGLETDEEIDHRRERDAKIAEDRRTPARDRE